MSIEVRNITNKDLLFEITIPQYIREVTLSQSMNPKYIKLGQYVPDKYINKNNGALKSIYKFQAFKNGKQYLVDTTTGMRVVTNERKMGKPNKILINGQKIYNQEVHKHSRAKMMDEIKMSYNPYLCNIPPIDISDFPIMIELEIMDEIYSELSQNKLWDVGNRAYPYTKGFEDAMKFHGIIPDDNLLYITAPPSPIFTPVDNAKDRMLIFRIYKDTRDVIKNCIHYERDTARKTRFFKSDFKPDEKNSWDDKLF